MRIQVGKGSCGIAAGAGEVFTRIEQLIRTEGLLSLPLSYDLRAVGCIGMCYLEPIVDVIDESGFKQTYVNVTREIAENILKNPEAAEKNRLTASPFLERQTRIALRNCGLIDPEDIAEYKAAGGYEAYKAYMASHKPQDLIDVLKISRLAGRGGAGFPTWFKWQALADQANPDKYIVCNADEGDPGAFMDRAILESDPHSVIEGMLIGAFATGAKHGVIYVRAEYPLAVSRLKIALAQARAEGLLNKNFDIHIKTGAGAFVCGEETALIASLEGERGMPRLKPPFPAQRGFEQKPTNINNVETFANLPWILSHGGEAFAAMGTTNSKGTKVFALTGKINNGGLVEIPMGVTLRDVVFEIGGGTKDGRAVKAVQLGGPSGGCIPESLLDTVIDYKNLSDTGAIMGSGGMVVMDESTCMVDMARFFLDFICKESCGKCVHCRIGSKRMLEILTRITLGKGQDGDIALLEELALQVKDGAMCGLGASAPNPVLTTLRYFRAEYEAHIKDRVCPAGQCKALIHYRIDPALCAGCTRCAKACPAQCISGEVRKAHTIDENKCVKCGKCASVCAFSAVARLGGAV